MALPSVLLLVPFLAQGDGAGAAGAATHDRVDLLAQEGHFLAAIVELERRLERLPTHPGVIQQLATFQSFVGDEAAATRTMARLGEPSRGSPPSAALSAALAGCTPLPALDEIARLAADRRIVILNEAHHVPRHRAFAHALAERLRALGFDYLACETFTAECATLATRGHPTRATGYYTVEPLFAEFVRAAVGMGYRPIHYEIEPEAGAPTTDVTDRINRREIAQCDHLVARIFDRDPSARVFIHCGWSHATENWSRTDDDREIAWMAARLARRSGLDPLTIDQTVHTPTDGAESAAVTFARRRGWLTQPLLLRRAGGDAFVDGDDWAGRVDLQVLHPVAELLDGRPGWMHGAGGRTAAEIPVELEPPHGRWMISAFRADAPAGALAVDRIVLEASEPCPVLLLPPGRYRIEAEDESGTATGSATIDHGE
ncbi:MAG: hypothetical protein FJ293_09395 [Planctomycetes bacterium]|nr:hypothetical protein [Planctomycetota bacterium]